MDSAQIIAISFNFPRVLWTRLLFLSSGRSRQPAGAHPRKACNISARPRQAGLTLIETMVTVAVGAILTAFTAPAFIDLIAAQRVKSATFDFYSSIVYARSEAIKRDAVINIAPRDGDFAKGWDIRVGGTVLRAQTNLANVVTTAPEGIALAYANDGRLTAAGRYVMTLAASGNPSVTMRCIVIDPSGRASIRLDNNRDGNCFNG